MNATFSVNLYDQDGDQHGEDCILLHCGDSTILVFDNVTELEKFAKQIDACVKEIRENYST